VTDDPYFQMYYIPRYFYRRLFVQRAPKYQWQRRAVALDHAWLRAAQKGKKKKKETERRKEEEEEEVEERREAAATARLPATRREAKK